MYSVLHEFLERYPGAALEISQDGTVVVSNKLLDASIGRDLEQKPLADVLDESSQAKWRNLLSQRGEVRTYELAFHSGDSLEARRFIAIWSLHEPMLWLIEHQPEAVGQVGACLLPVGFERTFGELLRVRGQRFVLDLPA